MKEDEINRLQNEINSRSIADFDNLSPSDMHLLIYDPFSENSIIQFKKEISDKILDKIGFLKLIEFILQKLSENDGIKLTKWNNLNTKLVTEIYNLNFTGEEIMQLKERKVYKQDDLLSLQNSIIILNDILKFTKNRKGKMSLTKQGRDFVKKESRVNLFKVIFKAHGLKFNWSFHDGYPEEAQIQQAFGYILYLILQYGHEEKGTSFYAEKLLKAFPQMIEDFKSDWGTPEGRMKSCLSIRCFERFLNWFNLIEVRKQYQNREEDDTFIMNTLISDILELDKIKFKFKRGKFLA